MMMFVLGVFSGVLVCLISTVCLLKKVEKELKDMLKECEEILKKLEGEEE